MATKLGTAVLYLLGDDSGLQKTIKDTDKGIMSTLGNVGKAAAGLAVGAVAAVGVGLAAALTDSAKAAMDAERVTAQLNATLKATGGASGQTQQGIEALSLKLSEIVPIEDDVITGAQSMLLTFKNIGKDIFEDTTKAVLDMATAMNRGATPSAEQLQTTSIMLGKALNDPLAGMGALSKAGVKLSESQQQQIKSLLGTSDQLEKLGKASSAAATAQKELPLTIALAEEKLKAMTAGGKASALQLEDQRAKIKGLRDELAAAPATMKAYEDAMSAANDPIKQQANLLAAQKIILGEVESQFKGSAEAAGKTFAGQMQILNNVIGNVKEEIGGALLPILAELATKYGPMVIAFAKDAGKWMVSDLIPAIKATFQWIEANLIPVLSELATKYGPGLIAFAKDAAKWIASDLIPAIKVTVEWLADNLVPAIVTVVKWLSENLGPVIQDVARWIQTDFIPAVQAIVQWLSVNLPPAIEFAGRVFNDLKSRIDGITGAIRTAIQWVSDLIERLRQIRMPNLSGGFSFGQGGMGAQSFGGTGAFGGLAMAGAGLAGPQNTAYNITINAPGGDPQAVKTAVLDGLATARARGMR